MSEVRALSHDVHGTANARSEPAGFGVAEVETMNTLGDVFSILIEARRGIEDRGEARAMAAVDLDEGVLDDERDALVVDLFVREQQRVLAISLLVSGVADSAEV